MSQLQAGAAEVNLTPPLGCELQGDFLPRYAEEIHDELYAKAVVLEHDGVRVGLVVADIIDIPEAVSQAVKDRVAGSLGIPPSHLVVAATHTHTGPAISDGLNSTPVPGYLETLPDKLADAVELAARRLEPAQLGYAVGACPSEVHCRRWHMADGAVKMNPVPGSPERVKPTGEPDPTLTVIVVRRPDRSPLAVVGNLALHYVGAPGRAISADYFGVFAGALQRCAGQRFTAILTNGCQGDVNNTNFHRPRPKPPHPYHAIERAGNVVAGEAWKAWNTLWEEDFDDAPQLGGALTRVPMKVRKPTPEQFSAAQAYLAGHDRSDNVVAWTIARDHVVMADWPDQFDYPLQALRLGNLGLVAFPAQLFAESAVDVRRRSPFPHTCCLGLANASGGYVAPDEQIDLGGYSVELKRHTCAAKGTVQAWTAAAVDLLGQLHSGGPHV